MKFLINLFICLLFIGCVPLDSNTEDSKDNKEEVKEKTQDNKSSSEVKQQVVVSNPLSTDDKGVLDYLKTQLLASINSKGVVDEKKGQYISKLNGFFKWLNENPDKGRELAKVGKDLQDLIKSKSNGTLENLENVKRKSNDSQNLKEQVKQVFDMAYNTFGDIYETNEKALEDLKNTLSDNNNHLDGIKIFVPKR
ncbi:hypothetical protein DB313_05475 (plasmid) [Borrelia turcica IST7]|uniref:Uncharacterized protein n=1 Tax=Borrelia turcica IST7 TaxID=1104446 RepID=A0A386PPT8_9SPIR|nr:hypothetical protein [Borrelia turcica]AYE36949.1 hypothetical protein DB313_05475 [Borrelia turcica IST7]